MQQRCNKYKVIIEILHKSYCSPNSPLREKFEEIKRLKAEYKETVLCEAFNVSKGSYYNHIFRNNKDQNMFIQREKELTPVIGDVFIKSNYMYGPNKIQALLSDRGYKVSQRVVARIMHENQWLAVRTSSKTLYKMYQERKENILAQKFDVKKPNEVWASDVTYFKLNDKTYYICAIMDLFSRKIISYKISDRNTSRLTIGTFNQAFNSRLPECEHLLFHSDNGSNYTSRSFMSELHSHGIKQSFSRPGIPYDNSVMESFFKSFKAEELYIGRYSSERKLKEGVDMYMDFYNSKRPHSYNRYKSPNKTENLYWGKE